MSSVATLAPYVGGARLSNRLLATWAGRWFDCAKDWRGTGRTPHTRIVHPDRAAALFSEERGNRFCVAVRGPASSFGPREEQPDTRLV